MVSCRDCWTCDRGIIYLPSRDRIDIVETTYHPSKWHFWNASNHIWSLSIHLYPVTHNGSLCVSATQLSWHQLFMGIGPACWIAWHSVERSADSTLYSCCVDVVRAFSLRFAIQIARSVDRSCQGESDRLDYDWVGVCGCFCDRLFNAGNSYSQSQSLVKKSSCYLRKFRR